jgi:hypothetical protein
MNRRSSRASAAIVALPLAALLAGPMLASPAQAETRRMAVLIGNNAGSGLRPPLAFAETDAQKMADVLVELGEVPPGAVELLRGQGLDQVRATLDRVAGRVRQIQSAGADRVVLVFYFSGHSDGEALEIGRDRLTFADVRRWMQETGAAVRLAIVDSCHSGGLIARKGGRLGPLFDVRLADHLASHGEAVITSSASSEAALESAEIRSSYFSHHLVSGLRGAADVSGDGLVTLGEAYQYAFGRTVRATADTLAGPQHPVYDYRLTGRGELVLTRLGGSAGRVEIPAGFDRLLLFDGQRQEVVAELGAAGPRRLATRAGAYEVRAWRGRRMYHGRVAVADGQTSVVTSGDLVETPGQVASAKGEASPGIETGAQSPRDRRWGLAIAAGLGRAAGEGVGGLGGLRVLLAPRPDWALVLTGATGRGTRFRESHLQVRVGRHHHRGGRLRVRAGLEVGGGLAVQTADGSRRRQSGTAVAAALVGLQWLATPGTTLGVLAEAPLLLARRDGELSALLLPGAWLAASF